MNLHEIECQLKMNAIYDHLLFLLFSCVFLFDNFFFLTPIFNLVVQQTIHSPISIPLVISLSFHLAIICVAFALAVLLPCRWEEAFQLLEEMKTSRISNTHQVIGSMIKGDYDDESNWQMVEYVLDRYNSEGCGFGLRLYNALLDTLWWLGQKARAARLLNEATRRSLYPELFRQSRLVWSVDVHR